MPSDGRSLWESIHARGAPRGRLLGRQGEVALAGLAHGSSLGGRLEELRGRSVLVAAKDQLTAALVLMELDGVARLEDALGIDPFNSTEALEFPVTFGDFVRLYENFAK